MTYPVTPQRPAEIPDPETPSQRPHGAVSRPDHSLLQREVAAEKPKKTASSGVSLQDSAQDAAPCGELQSVEPELLERAREAVAALRGKGRGPDGRFQPGNTMRLQHGLRCERLLDHPDIAAWHREQVAAIEADLGGEQQLTALQRAHVREAARLEVLVGALGDDLLARGVLTGKGRTRAAATLYLQALDRYLRVAQALGLQRRERPVPTVAELLGER